MINNIKEPYVLSKHNRAISQMKKAKGSKKDKWKTYIYCDGKRKEIVRKKYEEIIDYLYDYYSNIEKKTLSDCFDLFTEYKSECQNRSINTIREYKRYFLWISEALRNKAVTDITEEDISKWLISDLLKNKKPRLTALKKLFQLLDQIFRYAIKKKYCNDNPMSYLDINDYLKSCNTVTKSLDEKSFSDEEINRIKKYMLDKTDNPRALIALLAIHTGMRAGELVALHKTDITDDYIHIHRQQIRNHNTNPPVFEEVGFTKNERTRPNAGRKFPINQEIKNIIELANSIPGDSVYLFHDKNKSSMITKDSYEQFLNRSCTKLKTNPKHNHAFRVSLNRKMIQNDISPTVRALTLGHTVETNERFYSFPHSDELERMKNFL